MSAKKPAAKSKAKTSNFAETNGATKHKPSSGTKVSTQVTDVRCNAGRGQDDRRTPVEVNHRPTERRAKVNRRRQIDPTTCERDYSPEEVAFMSALDDYKRRSGRMFPTCSEILEVFKSLGYEKRPAPTSGGHPVLWVAPGTPELPTVAQPAEPVSTPMMVTEQAV